MSAPLTMADVRIATIHASHVGAPDLARALLASQEALRDYERYVLDGPLDEIIPEDQYARLKAALLPDGEL